MGRCDKLAIVMKNIPRFGRFFLNSVLYIECNISINIHDKIMFLSKVLLWSTTNSKYKYKYVQLQVQYLLYILKYSSNETITDAK